MVPKITNHPAPLLIGKERYSNGSWENMGTAPEYPEPLNNDGNKKEQVCKSGKPLAPSAVARKLGISAAAVDKRRQDLQLLGIPAKEYGYVYPAFQFEQDGSIVKDFDRLLYILADFDPWLQLEILQTSHNYLGGATPVEKIEQGRIDLAIDAFRSPDGLKNWESARSNEIKKQLLFASGKPLTHDRVAYELNISVEEVNDRRKEKKLMAAPSEEYDYLYPAFQFQDGSVIKHLDELLSSLAGFDVWMQLWFLQTGDIHLNGATPIEILKQGDLGRVLRAADNYGKMRAA
jgi:hypothetical protein